MTEIRWKQRFENYLKAQRKLKEGIDIYNEGNPTEFEKMGIIHAFEFTYNMCMEVLQDYCKHHKIEIPKSDDNSKSASPKDIVKCALEHEFIEDKEAWFDIIKARNYVSHNYGEKEAKEILESISASYNSTLEKMNVNFQKKYEEEEG